MNYYTIKQAAKYTAGEIKQLLQSSIQEEYVNFEAFSDDLAKAQIDAFAKKYETNIKQHDIHFFQMNPKFFAWLKKEEPLENKLDKNFLFIEEITLDTPTFYEKDPYMVLPENYTYILFKKNVIQSVVARLANDAPLEQVIYQALITNESIVKQRILESEPLKNLNFKAPCVIEDSLAIYAKWLAIEKEHCDIHLLVQKFEISLLNYFIRVYIGPVFQTYIENNDIEKIERMLDQLQAFLAQQDKLLVSSLVSLGYFFIQLPIMHYEKLQSNQNFMKQYIAFAKFLFSKLHFNSRQYYLKYYRQATNAIYKAVRLNSEKPLKKCYQLYFSK